MQDNQLNKKNLLLLHPHVEEFQLWFLFIVNYNKGCYDIKRQGAWPNNL
jgi:hypothetical protein